MLEKKLEGSRVLVTGGAGFVGGNLSRKLLQDGPAELLIVDNLLSSDVENVPSHPSVTFIEGSIADDRILASIDGGFDFVFHLATYHGNQSSIHDPLADHEHNTLTTLKLLEHLKGVGGSTRIVYASAGCTVAEKTSDDVSATSEDAPLSLYHDSPYQISKIIGELYANYYGARHGLDVVKARFQNVYGPGEILGAGRWRGTPATVWRNVVPSFIYRALARQSLPLENGGAATRDFVFVDDVVEGLRLCALRGGSGEVYNLASGVETSIATLAATINECTGNPTPPLEVEGRDWDRSGRRFGSTVKAQAELRFVAPTPLGDGIRQTVEWTRNNISVIQRCMNQHRRYVDIPDVDLSE